MRCSCWATRLPLQPGRIADRVSTFRLNEDEKKEELVRQRLGAPKKLHPAPVGCRIPSGTANFVIQHHRAGTRSFVVGRSPAASLKPWGSSRKHHSRVRSTFIDKVTRGGPQEALHAGLCPSIKRTPHRASIELSRFAQGVGFLRERSPSAARIRRRDVTGTRGRKRACSWLLSSRCFQPPYRILRGRGAGG